MEMKLLLVHSITSMLAACYESLHGNTLLSVHKTYHMHVCMLQLLHGNDIDCFGLDLVYSRFCQVLRNLSFNPCSHISCIGGLHKFAFLYKLPQFPCLKLGPTFLSWSEYVLL